MKGKKTGGKKKGSINKKTKEWEAIGESLTTTHAKRFNEILSTSEDDKFVRMFLEVMEYFRPKQSRVEMKDETEKKINIRIVRT